MLLALQTTKLFMVYINSIATFIWMNIKSAHTSTGEEKGKGKKTPFWTILFVPHSQRNTSQRA
jgi:hypothetical protein